MPIVNGKYVNPGWQNDAPPAIDADELNAMSGTLENSFVALPENFSPDLNTFRILGSFTRNNFVIANAPPGSSPYGIAYNVFGKSPAYITQHYFDAAKKMNWRREFVDTSWSAWVEPLDSKSIIPGWKLLWTAYPAGSGNWVAPDINYGRTYKVGVFIISGGGSGADLGTESGSYVQGGFSGRTKSFILEVTPGQSVPWVVGAGGARAGGYNNSSIGNNGGASSFNGVTALGGTGGRPYVYDLDGRLIFGAQSPAVPGWNDTIVPFGGVIVPSSRVQIGSNIAWGNFCGVPSECINPFTNEQVLGAGGSIFNGPPVQISPAGKSGITGLGGGNAVANNQGEDATSPGCGGGASMGAGSSGTGRKSGAGADGAILIYVGGMQ